MNKTIKEIIVKVTYKERLCDFEVSENTYRGLCKIRDYGRIDGCYDMGDDDIAYAFDWISSNITEGDSFGWEYEIEDLETEDQP